MTRYWFSIDFSSDRDQAELERILVGVLEKKLGAQVHALHPRARESAGRPPRMKKAVLSYLEEFAPGDEVVLEEVAESTGFSYYGIRRIAHQLVQEGRLTSEFSTAGTRSKVYHIPPVE